MKIALIPPIPHLDFCAKQGEGFQMILAPLLRHESYLLFHRNCKRAGDYMILDNGAHEMQDLGLGIKLTLRCAVAVGADEIVLPDVPRHALRTQHATHAALEYLTTEGKRLYDRAGRPQLMYVPQGRTFESWQATLRAMLRMHGDTKYGAPTIGIAKHHLETTGVRLVEFVQAVREQTAGHIHLLGWPRDLWQLRDVARRDVRSVDSARPFVYAQHGDLLEPGGKIPPYPGRGQNYFTDALSPDALATAWRNVEVFRAAATGALI